MPLPSIRRGILVRTSPKSRLTVINATEAAAKVGRGRAGTRSAGRAGTSTALGSRSRMPASATRMHRDEREAAFTPGHKRDVVGIAHAALKPGYTAALCLVSDLSVEEERVVALNATRSGPHGIMAGIPVR